MSCPGIRRQSPLGGKERARRGCQQTLLTVPCFNTLPINAQVNMGLCTGLSGPHSLGYRRVVRERKWLSDGRQFLGWTEDRFAVWPTLGSRTWRSI